MEVTEEKQQTKKKKKWANNAHVHNFPFNYTFIFENRKGLAHIKLFTHHSTSPHRHTTHTKSIFINKAHCSAQLIPPNLYLFFFGGRLS